MENYLMIAYASDLWVKASRYMEAKAYYDKHKEEEQAVEEFRQFFLENDKQEYEDFFKPVFG